MKALEDKLYINLFKGVYNVCSYPVGNAQEYIRTDAFIEKAAKWLEENINEYTDGEGIEFTADMTYNIDILFQEKLINEFKKAMKL